MIFSPIIKASFVLDASEKPSYFLYEYTPSPTHKNYRIRLYVVNTPADAYAVTYTLHETYYDPVRESRDRANEFPLEITSYGDFIVLALVRSKEGAMTVSALLSSALEAGYGPNLSAEIQEALRDIRSN